MVFGEYRHNQLGRAGASPEQSLIPHQKRRCPPPKFRNILELAPGLKLGITRRVAVIRF